LLNYLSISPKTISKEPKIVTISAKICEEVNVCKLYKCKNPGALNLHFNGLLK